MGTRTVFGIFIREMGGAARLPSQRLLSFNKSVVTLSCAPHSALILHVAFLAICLSREIYGPQVS